MDKIPPLSADLIDQLDTVYPILGAASLHEKQPRDLDFYLGQRSVIDFLRMRLQQSQDDALT